jgi:hypothetical protein
MMLDSNYTSNAHSDVGQIYGHDFSSFPALLLIFIAYEISDKEKGAVHSYGLSWQGQLPQ